MFSTYFELGLEHILDPQAYDHILFVLALTIIYPFKEWKRVLILVTAFTIGHSLTLALSVFNIVQVNMDIIEFLIPVTIILTALSNILSYGKQNRNHSFNYVLALVFGFIHGLGFSNYLSAILGREDSVVGPLFSFNLGVEAGQVCIVLVTLLFTYILTQLFKIPARIYVLGMSILIILIAASLLF